MNRCNPILLLSSERSGTNLLRAIISSHSKIASPPPSGMVESLADSSYRYFPPLNPPHTAELVEDVIALTQTHMNPWEVELSFEMISERMKETSFWELFSVVNDIYADQYGALSWFSKEPGLFKHIYEINSHMPQAKFIYMVRDGRDVAASMLKGGVHETSIYSAARRWSSEQVHCLVAMSDPILRDNIFMIRYEDLISDTESVVTSLMEFLGLDFESEQMDFYKQDHVVKHAEKSVFWKNISKPVDSSNKGKYKKSLSKSQVEMFESVAWVEMNALGYKPELQQRKTFSMFSRIEIRLREWIKKKFNRFDMTDRTKQRAARQECLNKIENRFLDFSD